jgi:tetratricopeptide (TPR) repeat protein
MKHKLIQVRYCSGLEGSVDDITLNELILSHKIGQFYRPSQEKWIDIEIDPVRISKSQYGGPERRELEEEEAEQLEEKPHGLLSRILRLKRKPIALKKALTAEDWFERGFQALHIVNDGKGALRAFAKSIDLDPTYQSAYLNRGITFEIVGNLQQAIYDYSKVIELAPGDAKVYYLRGLASKRLGMDDEAIKDLKEAASMGHRQAMDFFKSKGVYL